MEHEFIDEQNLDESQVDALLADLELRCRPDVAAAREMTTCRTRMELVIRPGNASERDRPALTGHTSDLRTQGTTCLVSTPIGVGDIYHLTFDRAALDVEPLLAVCDRCTMLADANFEARFRFVHEVRIPSRPVDEDRPG